MENKAHPEKELEKLDDLTSETTEAKSNEPNCGSAYRSYQEDSGRIGRGQR